MIPKIIHYIWLGGKPLPKIAEKCIKSWKKYCPDYEIKRWDESNIDLNKYSFAKDAYESKKYAFASDVFRTDILFSEGGVELLYLFDNLATTNNRCFVGGKGLPSTLRKRLLQTLIDVLHCHHGAYF